MSENPELGALRPRRANRRLPKRFRDLLPTALPPAPPLPASPGLPTPLPRVTLNVWERVRTAPNVFGLYREFLGRPSHVPDEGEGLAPEELLENSGEDVHTDEGNVALKSTPHHSQYYPFPNFTQYAISNHFLNAASGQRSAQDFDHLMRVISDPRFVPSDLRNFRNATMQHLLDSIDTQSGPGLLTGDDGWKRNVEVIINVPEGKRLWSSPSGVPFSVPGLCHRSLVQVIRKVYTTATNLHFTPFMLFHKAHEQPPTRVWGDLFSSPAFIDAHKALPKIPGCSHERAVAPLVFWSDSTHLASFGTAKLWPIYLFFGSQEKRLRGKPNAHLCHHVAYIPSVSVIVTSQTMVILIVSGSAI